MQSQTVTREKLLKMLSYKKGSCKVLVKLTAGERISTKLALWKYEAVSIYHHLFILFFILLFLFIIAIRKKSKQWVFHLILVTRTDMDNVTSNW